MMSSQNVTDYFCCDCQESFNSASQLLTHFAVHASQNESSAINSFVSDTKNIPLYDLFTKKPTNIENGKCVPDLFPINAVKKGTVKKKLTKSNLESLTDSLEDQTSYIKKCLESFNINNQVVNDPEDFNPLNFCSVSIEETKQNENHSKIKQLKSKKIMNKETKSCTTKKKYKCTVCNKVFGWSTDLKRHLLIHSGIRPFKCNVCDATFTRNFLLQNHVAKKHDNSTNKLNNMPNLKPIFKDKTLKMQSLNKTFNVNLVKNETLVQ